LYFWYGWRYHVQPGQPEPVPDLEGIHVWPEELKSTLLVVSVPTALCESSTSAFLYFPRTVARILHHLLPVLSYLKRKKKRKIFCCFVSLLSPIIKIGRVLRCASKRLSQWIYSTRMNNNDSFCCYLLRFYLSSFVPIFLAVSSWRRKLSPIREPSAQKEEEGPLYIFLLFCVREPDNLLYSVLYTHITHIYRRAGGYTKEIRDESVRWENGGSSKWTKEPCIQVYDILYLSFSILTKQRYTINGHTYRPFNFIKSLCEY
jgi:hypothetical protein